MPEPQPANQPVARIACGLSDDPDTQAACDKAIRDIAPLMRGSTDLVTVFFSPHHIQQAEHIISTMYDSLAPECVLGVSASSVAGNDDELENRPGLVVMAACLPGVQLKPFTDSDLDWPASESEPERLREAVGADADDLRAVLLLADPFTPIGRLLPAMSSSLMSSPDEPSVPLIGGIASAGSQPRENRLLCNDTMRLGGIVGLSISGPVRVDTVVSQGCRPIGKPMVVTTAQRNIIQTLGGKPALQVFEELAVDMDPEDRRLLEKGLFLGRVINEYKDRFGRGDFLIRNILGVDRSRGWLAVGDFVRVGQTVQFHVRDARTAAEDLELVLAAQKLDEEPLGGMLFTCNGRGTALFDVENHDVRTIRGAFPDMPLAGFFAGGEIGPVGHESFLHGHTAALALFRPI